MDNNNIKQTIDGWKMVACLLCLLVIACTGNNDDTGMIPSVDADAAIGFSTDVSMRTNTLIEDTADLKKTGIGVFGYFTDNEKWADSKTDAIPDFMYNQLVSWGIQRIDNISTNDGEKPVPVYGWIYSPVKYWPNSSDNGKNRYISFFAYAPWQADPTEAPTYGVIEIPNGTDKSPHLKYRMGPVGNMTDLLYADAVTDATRNGYGLIEIKGEKNTYQNVPLKFHHALACVEIYIQRIYDEPHYSGKAPEDEKQTKLFVSKLELASNSNVHEEGDLDLETGTWSGYTSSTSSLTYTEDMFNDSISGTVETNLNIIADRELNKWGRDGFGIDERERCLFKESNVFFFPQELTLTPTLTYTMVTRDNELLLSDYTDISGNKYARIMHEVQGNSLKLNIQKGKRYRLLIHVEAEHISFEVASVTDWDFPMRFDPSVGNDFKDENINHTLNEK